MFVLGISPISLHYSYNKELFEFMVFPVFEADTGDDGNDPVIYDDVLLNRIRVSAHDLGEFLEAIKKRILDLFMICKKTYISYILHGLFNVININ